MYYVKSTLDSLLKGNNNLLPHFARALQTLHLLNKPKRCLTPLTL